jgi:hypothetical protein
MVICFCCSQLFESLITSLFAVCFKKSFTTFKVYMYLFRGCVQCLNCHIVENTLSSTWNSYGSMWFPLVMPSVSKRALQWYFLNTLHYQWSVSKIPLQRSFWNTLHYQWKCRVFKKERCNGIPDVSVVVQGVEWWMVRTPLSANVFVTLATVTFGIPLKWSYWNTPYYDLHSVEKKWE